MSLGANFSSGHTNYVNQEASKPCACANASVGPVASLRPVASLQPVVPLRPGASACCTSGKTQVSPAAVYSSIHTISQLLSCPAPTPEQLASYPKVAVPSSVRTEAVRDRSYACAIEADPSQRFSKYRRYQPATPCLPLPQTAAMAGISKPSVRACNLYSGTLET